MFSCRCKKCADRAANKLVTLPNGQRRRRCDGCGRGIPPYTAMEGCGFESITPEHEFLVTDGLGGREFNFFMPVNLEFCYRCHLKDFAEHYPDKPLPRIANCLDWEDMPSEQPTQPELAEAFGCFTITA